MNYYNFFKNSKPEVGSTIIVVYIDEDGKFEDVSDKIEVTEDTNLDIFETDAWTYVSRKISPNDNLRKENIDFSLANENMEDWEVYKKQRETRGFDDTETWNLDCTIVKFILPRLKRFRELAQGYPADCQSMDEWNDKLNAIIYWLEHYEIGYSNDADEQKMNEGKKYFCDYFNDLWW